MRKEISSSKQLALVSGRGSLKERNVNMRRKSIAIFGFGVIMKPWQSSRREAVLKQEIIDLRQEITGI